MSKEDISSQTVLELSNATDLDIMQHINILIFFNTESNTNVLQLPWLKWLIARVIHLERVLCHLSGMGS